MLIIKEQPKKEPITIKHVLRGAEISLTIRPWDEKEIAPIRKKHTTYTFAKDPDTLQMVRVPMINMRALGEDVIDHLLVSFSGAGKTKDEPLEVTRENKLLLGSVEPLEGEEKIGDVVFRISNKLAASIEAENEAEIKNS